MKKIKSLDKKHNKIVKNYDEQKECYLEKLGTKSLAADEKFRKLRDKKMKGNFLKNF